MNAADLIAALEDAADPKKIDCVARFFQGDDPNTQIMGVPMPKVFPIAKAFVALPLSEIDALLDDPRYEVRMAAVSVMDFQARKKRLPDEDRKALFDLYLRRHDRLNNWDFVDRAAPHVIGEYLRDKDRSILDHLAHSVNPHERRTALVSTFAFIRRGDVSDTFRIAGSLVDDEDTYVQKAIGSWTREAGKKDPDALVAFLMRHKDRLPKSTIATSTMHLSSDQREAFGVKVRR
ncbi:DNA alkylation repair protein [uncultured Roseobacter sp.]|uniref:DNA alkylation repair protein n=1 Tax=uncultured Roseobacter sp. TaxID=114847 RepID=UPI00262B6498|nr:DNA alkylation repair protein [uncultured Roseobacter sp.]